MDCDAGGLWAITPNHDTRFSELYRIDPATGAATLIGATGVTGALIESLAIDRSSPSLRLVAGSTILYDIDPATGAATFLTDDLGTLWAMTSTVPEPSTSVLGLTALGALAVLKRRAGRRPSTGC